MVRVRVIRTACWACGNLIPPGVTSRSTKHCPRSSTQLPALHLRSSGTSRTGTSSRVSLTLVEREDQSFLQPPEPAGGHRSLLAQGSSSDECHDDRYGWTMLELQAATRLSGDIETSSRRSERHSMLSPGILILNCRRPSSDHRSRRPRVSRRVFRDGQRRSFPLRHHGIIYGHRRVSHHVLLLDQDVHHSLYRPMTKAIRAVDVRARSRWYPIDHPRAVPSGGTSPRGECSWFWFDRRVIVGRRVGSPMSTDPDQSWRRERCGVRD
jgi:hypothetical protein